MSCFRCGCLIPTSEERSSLLIESMQKILDIFAKAAKGEFCIECAVDDVRDVVQDLARVECPECHGFTRNNGCANCGHAGSVKRV